MKPKAIFLAIFFVIVVCSLLAFFGKATIPESIKPASSATNIPVPAAHGPYPKAIVVDGPLYDFGIMEQGQSGEHVFTVRNEGEVPLQMSAGARSCQCTAGSLEKNGLAPGEETTMTLSWQIKAQVRLFQHFAKFHTNDPLNPELSFRVRGFVGRKLQLSPATEFNIGTLSEGKPNERLLTLHSEIVDEFKIEKIETSTPLIAVVTRPLTPDELSNLSSHNEDEKQGSTLNTLAKKFSAGKTAEQAKQQQEDELADKALPAKCGYELKVDFQPGFPIGKFRESITIHTNLDTTETLTASFQGNRAGPIQILSTPGVAWSPEEGVLRFIRFRAADGTKAKLMLFVNKFDQEFAITEAKMDPPIVRYQLLKDKKFHGAGRDKFDLLLEVPPGETPITLGGQNRGQILLHTNHPDASTIKMNLEYTSF